MTRRGAWRTTCFSVLVAILILTASCSSGKARPATPAPSSPAGTAVAGETALPPPLIAWKACGQFDCGTLSVPLDYANPAGRHIDLALVRQKAKDEQNRVGVLIANNGGPGISTVDFIEHWAPALPSEIQNRFDVIGFDPRGVGQSTPLVCHQDLQKLISLDPAPDTPQGWQQVADETKSFDDACGQAGDGLLPYLGTYNVARDMDQVRAALGEDQITYFGYSYGTKLGQAYAELFPTRFRAMVLDGTIDLSLTGDQFALGQAYGFEGALNDFLAHCAETKCISANPGDPGAAIDEVLRRVKQSPIPSPGADRPAGPGETTTAIVGSLYTDGSWPALARAVDRALAGDGSNLVRLADAYYDRKPDGSYDNSTEMNIAVNCEDYSFSRDLTHYEQLAADMKAKAPRLGPAVATGGLSCAYWPAEPTPVKPPTPLAGPKILVIGTTRDPATPYPWAVAAAKQLGSAVLLTYRGEGHTAYRRDSCIDDAVNRYLLSLATPNEGTTCGDAALATPIALP